MVTTQQKNDVEVKEKRRSANVEIAVTWVSMQMTIVFRWKRTRTSVLGGTRKRMALNRMARGRNGYM